ncbi:MAG: AraC family transcriptional regulator [Pseudomonadota bacterium]
MDQPDSIHAPKSFLTEDIGYKIRCFAAGSHEVDIPQGWALLDLNLSRTEGSVEFEGIDEAPDRNYARSFSLIQPTNSYSMRFIRSDHTVQFYFKPHTLKILPAQKALCEISAPIWNHLDNAMLSAGDIVLEFVTTVEHEIKTPERAFIRDLFSVRLLQLLSKKKTEARTNCPAIQRGLEFIEANIHKPVQHNEVASAAGLSAFHFARRFRMSVGTSVRRYIVMRRLEIAQDMIENTTKSLAEIAFSTGFSSQSHMTTQFKRFTGRTPKSFRHVASEAMTYYA